MTKEAITEKKLLDILRSMRVAPAPPIPRIVESYMMIEDGEPYDEPRSWRERLLTLPWRPLKKMRTVVPKIPRKDAIQLSNGTLLVHPVTAQKLRALLLYKSY